MDETVDSYSAASRALQDNFDTRRLADRLHDMFRSRWTLEEARALIEAAPMFFLATADAQGRPHDRLLIAGPLARGSIGELVGAPEIATFTRAMIGALVARAWGAPAPVPSPPACTADPPALSASPHLAAAAPAGR